MKKFWIVVAVVVPLGIIVGAILWGKSIWSNLTFGTPYFVSADLKGLSLSDIPSIISSPEGKTINAVLGMQIKNDSSTSIPFCSLEVVLSYKGTEIARTSEAFKNACQTIPAKGKPNNPLNISDNIVIKLNKGGVELLSDKLLGKNPEIDSRIDLSVFGIPISKIYPIKSKFVW